MKPRIGGWADGRMVVRFAILLSVHPTIRLAAQCPDGTPPPCRAQPTRVAPAPLPNSVAVLYFDNLSPDTADAYLADGLTDELIARLGQLDRLVVKSRTAVRHYRGSTQDVAALGRALGVAHLVNGTVRRAGTRLRVTVELLRAPSGDRAWGSTYDRTDADLLALQEDIARAVASAIAGRLLPAERASLGARPTSRSDAYEHFLRGNYHFSQRNPRGAALAIQEYTAAIRLDPGFTAALARVAMSYGQILDWDWNYGGHPRDTLLARGLATVVRALQQDSTASDAWMARGYLFSFGLPRTRDHVEQAFARALSLDPHNAEASLRYGVLLGDLGQDSAAAAMFHRSLGIEPERAITLWVLGRLYFTARSYLEARRWIDSALAVEPGLYQGYALRALIGAQRGDTAGARADAETAMRLAPPEDRLYGESVMALLTLMAGDTLTARVRAERLAGEVADRQTSLVLWPGIVLIALGEHRRFLDTLDRLRWREPGFWMFLREPEFDPVRADPRFQRLVEGLRPQ